MSKDKLTVNTTVAEQAAYWAMRMYESDVTQVEREEFLRWVTTDSSHLNEFRAHTLLTRLAPELKLKNVEIQFPPAAERPAVEPESAPALPWYRAAVSGMGWTRARLGFAAAAAVAVLAVGGWLALSPTGFFAPSYATGTGQTRAITFEDGSVAYLNTRTRLQWKGDGKERRVALLEGEALFDVAHEPNRPFRVMLENSDIRVLGTRFNVYRKKSGEVIVTVLEGAVRVREYGQGNDPDSEAAWERELRANQQIAYRTTGLMRDVHTTTALDAIKWREGILEMRNEPLREVIEELTRYTDRRIVILDPRLAEQRLGGALSLRDVHVALGRIQKLVPVAVKENGSTFTLDYRRDSNTLEERP